MAQNLRGEMSSDFACAKLCLSDRRFIQVIAKSLSISCKEVRTPPAQTETAPTYHQTYQLFFNRALCGNKTDFFKNAYADAYFIERLLMQQELAAIRDALTPPLACAAAKIGDIEALQALKEMVSHPALCTTHI